MVNIMWGYVLGGAAALGLGYVFRDKLGFGAGPDLSGDALKILDFKPYDVQKGKLFRLSFITPADESPEAMNQWLQQVFYVAPQGLPKKVRTGVPVPGPATATSDVWQVNAVPLWPTFETPQRVTPANYGKTFLANQFPNMNQETDPRMLASLLFLAATAARDVPERKVLIFVGAEKLEK